MFNAYKLSLVIGLAFWLGYRPLCLITKMDEEAEHGGPQRTAQAKLQLQSLTGCASSDVHCITNYTDPTCNRRSMPDTDLATLRVVHAAMKNAREFLMENSRRQVLRWQDIVQQDDFAVLLQSGECTMQAGI